MTGQTAELEKRQYRAKRPVGPPFIDAFSAPLMLISFGLFSAFLYQEF